MPTFKDTKCSVFSMALNTLQHKNIFKIMNYSKNKVTANVQRENFMPTEIFDIAPNQQVDVHVHAPHYCATITLTYQDKQYDFDNVLIRNETKTIISNQMVENNHIVYITDD